MKYLSEEERILDKIRNRKTFQTESWSRLDFIFSILTSLGYQKRNDFALRSPNPVGWQYFYMNNTGEVVRVLAGEFFGSYIQVEFQ